jgi:cytochrome c oxidase assembly protein subunit 15
MGCPDWPKCFGEWIPPTSVEELPADYKKIFVAQRIEKNEKIVGYLQSLGFNELANTIENDPNVTKEEEFNAVKTWTEYINRLVGAIIGLLVIATFVTSLRYWETDKSIPLVSFAALLLTIFQGWLGSIVVSTNLLPGTISIHMIFAMVIVNVLLYGAFKATSGRVTIEMSTALKKKLTAATLFLLVITTVQMVLGTQVREAIDAVKLGSELSRDVWVSKTGTIFLIHRSFSWLVLIAGGYLLSIFWRNQLGGLLYKLAKINGALILAQIAIGVGLEYLGMPAVLQVLHLVGIAFMICGQFLMYLLLSQRTKTL